MNLPNIQEFIDEARKSCNHNNQNADHSKQDDFMILIIDLN